MAKSTLAIPKTYKLYIGGKFPRTESGRYLTTEGTIGPVHYCRASRKDFRNSVGAARAALPGWSGKTAYNRGQILYRIAEMLEGRRAQFIAELKANGLAISEANAEVNATIDCIIYYAGWSDKYQQVFSSVNPVAASYFNFSVYEPTGVVAILSSERPSLFGLVASMMSTIVGGNTCIILASSEEPLTSISFAEILHTSDVPGGVVNILTGLRSELLEQFAGHMDVNANIIYGDLLPAEEAILANAATHNMKRVILRRSEPTLSYEKNGPYTILDTLEVKTTWHPIGK